MADGSVKIEVLLDDSKVSGGVKKVEGRLSGIAGTAKRGLATVGKLAGALGLVGLAYKGIDMVKNSLDGAIDRYDTLNQFPRVMALMGFDAEESERAINKLSDGIQGLPTRLDEVASTAQNIAVMTGDLDLAVDTTLALNNAFLASGASTADAERGLRQYVNMLAKGEVDAARWETLQETMGVALNKVAEAFGFAGKTAQDDLYDALKSGEITFDEFNNKIIELSEQTGGFADIAQEASKGLKTSLGNLNTWILTGVADVIGAIDKALGGTGEIADAIDRLKPIVQSVFGWIASNIPVVVEKIKEIVQAAKDVYNAIQPWLPLFAAIAAGVGTFMLLANGATIVSAVITKAVAVFNILKTAIMAARVAMITLNAAILANPIALLIAAIVAAAVLIYVYWEPISEFFINLWNTIKEAGLLIWENLQEGWSNAKNNLTEAWQSVTEFFSNLWQSIVDVFLTAYEWLNGITGGAFGEYVAIVQANLMVAWEIIKAIWGYIKDTFSNFLAFLKALVTLDFEGMKNAMKNQMENARNLLSNIWEAIKNNIGAKLKEILSNLINKFTSMVSNVRSKATEIVNTARQKFEEVKQRIREKLTEAVRVVGEKIGEMPGKVIEFASDMVSAGKDLVKGLIDGIKNMGASAIEAITGVVGGVIEKAKSLLKISSPSKLFEQYGKWTGEGLAKGIESMQKVAEKASEKLGLGVDDALSSQLQIDSLRALRGYTPNAVLAGYIPNTLQVTQQLIESTKHRQQQPVIKLETGDVVMDGRKVGEIVWRPVKENIDRDTRIIESFRG